MLYRGSTALKFTINRDLVFVTSITTWSNVKSFVLVLAEDIGQMLEAIVQDILAVLGIFGDLPMFEYFVLQMPLSGSGTSLMVS